MNVSLMKMSDYNDAYELWNKTEGMGMRSLDDSEAGIRKFLLRNPNTNFVCRIDGELVGLILCGHDGRRAYIYHAVVSKEYRSKGIGKLLLENVIEAVRGEEIHKIALVVYEKNTIGNDFWKSQGFTVRNDLNYRNKSINELNI
jgi:ribosomal protein S18 acetylase RimI-like enzyme